MSDGSVILGVDLNAQKVKQKLKALGDDFKKLGNKADDSLEDAWDEIEKDTEKGTRSVKKRLNSLSNSFSSVSKKLGTLGKGFVTAVAAIGTGLVTAGAYAINLASDLQEVQNVVDVTFGAGAEKINSFAREAAAAYGLSELSAKQYSSTMGAMLKSMGLAEDEVLDMSQALTGLAGDMASFYNISSDEAFEKLRSGISGETEPLKQLGINMSVANLEAYALSQGITKSYNAMSEAEKVALRYNYIMSATADAQGDFARTSDSLANQLRILKMQGESLAATVGTALLPMAQSAVEAVGGFVQRLNEAFDTGGTQALVKELGSVLSDALTMIAESAPAVVDVAVSLIDSFAQGLIDNSDAVVAAAGDILISLASGIISLLPTLLDVAVTLIGSLGEYIIDSLPLLIEAAPEIIRSLTDGIISSLSDLSESASEMVSSFVEYVLTNLPEIFEAGVEIVFELIRGVGSAYYALGEVGASIITGLGEGISSSLDKIGEKAQEIVNEITSTISSLPATMFEYGKNTIKGFIDGLKQKWESSKPSVQNIVSGVKKLFSGGFEIHSPSKWAKRVGAYVMQGLGLGFAEKTAYAETMASTSIKSVKDTMTEEIEALNKEIESLQKKTVKTQKELDEEALENKRDALKALEKEYDSALSEIEKSQERMIEKLSDYGEMFVIDDKTGKLDLGTIDDNVRALKEYDRILEELSNKSVGDDFLAEFVGLDIDEALQLGRQLLKSEEVLTKYVESWNEQQKLAQEIAQKYYKDELDALENDFSDKLDTALGKIPEQTKDIGKDSIDGWVEGLEAREGTLYAAVRRIANSMLAAMRSELDINSPSEKTKKLVGEESAAGVEVGFVERMKIANARMQEAVSAEHLRLTTIDMVQAKGQISASAGETRTYYNNSTVERTPVIEFKGSLAGLAKALLPHIRVEEKRIGSVAMQGVTE